MSARSSTFRQADIARALRAAKDAGLQVARYEVGHDGRVIVFTTSGDAVPSSVDELDRELAEFEARRGDH